MTVNHAKPLEIQRKIRSQEASNQVHSLKTAGLVTACVAALLDHWLDFHVIKRGQFAGVRNSLDANLVSGTQ